MAKIAKRIVCFSLKKYNSFAQQIHKIYEPLKSFIMKKDVLKIIAVAVVMLFVTVSCKKDQNVTNVTLDKNNITLDIGETATLKANVHPEDAANKTVSWTSSNSAVADVINGIITAKEVGKTTITVTTDDGNFTAECIVTVTPEWVEISGIKWAKRNVDMPGTFAAKPEDAGMFYQWNRKVGWSSTDPLMSSNGDSVWYKIPNDPGNFWNKDNDHCPIGWRVPTITELESLIIAGTEWITLNGVNGRIFGSGDNTIFLPAAGAREYYIGGLYGIGENGQYWSNSLIAMNTIQFLGFDMSDHFTIWTGSHSWLFSFGYSVRCVAE